MPRSKSFRAKYNDSQNVWSSPYFIPERKKPHLWKNISKAYGGDSGSQEVGRILEKQIYNSRSCAYSFLSFAQFSYPSRCQCSIFVDFAIFTLNSFIFMTYKKFLYFLEHKIVFLCLTNCCQRKFLPVCSSCKGERNKPIPPSYKLAKI